MKYRIKYSSTFKKSYKLCKRRGYDMTKLKEVIAILESKGELPPKYRPHILSGRYAGKWECHIESDWLLVWIQENDTMTLLFIDTGTHSDIF